MIMQLVSNTILPTVNSAAPPPAWLLSRNHRGSYHQSWEHHVFHASIISQCRRDLNSAASQALKELRGN